MKITLTSPDAADSLQNYLQSCGCTVARIDERTIEASAPPRSIAAEHGDVELEAYLRVWRELNGAFEIGLAPEPSERATAEG
jgi:hypothetical protein